MPDERRGPDLGQGGWAGARRAAAAVHISPGDGVRWVILSPAPPEDDEPEAERSTSTRVSRRGR